MSKGKFQSGNCSKCGVYRQCLHADHIVERWRGGGNDPSNIQLLCANCHEDKTIGERQSAEYKEMLSKKAKSRPTKASMEEDDIIYCHKLYKAGYGYHAIAEELGYSYVTIRRCIGRKGVYKDL